MQTVRLLGRKFIKSEVSSDLYSMWGAGDTRLYITPIDDERVDVRLTVGNERALAFVFPSADLDKIVLAIEDSCKRIGLSLAEDGGQETVSRIKLSNLALTVDLYGHTFALSPEDSTDSCVVWKSGNAMLKVKCIHDVSDWLSVELEVGGKPCFPLKVNTDDPNKAIAMLDTVRGFNMVALEGYKPDPEPKEGSRFAERVTFDGEELDLQRVTDVYGHGISATWAGSRHELNVTTWGDWIFCQISLAEHSANSVGQRWNTQTDDYMHAIRELERRVKLPSYAVEVYFPDTGKWTIAKEVRTRDEAVACDEKLQPLAKLTDLKTRIRRC